MSAKTSTKIEQEIIRLYTTPDKSGAWVGVQTIEKLVGISSTSVQNILKRNGIKMRNAVESHANGKRCKPIKNLPPGEPPLCKCGCGNRVAWNRRKNSWSIYGMNHRGKDAPYKDPEWLRHQYEDLKRMAQSIAQDFNVDKATIFRHLRKFGIPVRPQRESLALSGAVRGVNNPAWKGGIAQWAYAHNWKRIARSIRKRDNYTCQVCKVQFPKSSKLLHVHHMDGDKFNNDFSNLVTVCATCHPKGKRKENGSI